MGPAYPAFFNEKEQWAPHLSHPTSCEENEQGAPHLSYRLSGWNSGHPLSYLLYGQRPVGTVGIPLPYLLQGERTALLQAMRLIEPEALNPCFLDPRASSSLPRSPACSSCSSGCLDFAAAEALHRLATPETRPLYRGNRGNRAN